MSENKIEYEKMISGKLYDANYNEDLLRLRNKTQDLCFEYNNIKPSDLEKRTNALKNILGDMKERCIIEQPFWCDYGFNIKVGENFYANHNLVILDANIVEFGNNVFIGPNSGFYTAGHPIDYSLRNEGLEYAKKIKVGDNVWFGGNVVVLPGVSIGSNVVIGARSVVTKDIPDNCVGVGNPCRMIKKIEGRKYL